jgi:hypothetical protein
MAVTRVISDAATSSSTTFADNPVASPAIAEAKLRAIVQAAEILRSR